MRIRLLAAITVVMAVAAACATSTEIGLQTPLAEPTPFDGSVAPGGASSPDAAPSDVDPVSACVPIAGQPEAFQAQLPWEAGMVVELEVEISKQEPNSSSPEGTSSRAPVTVTVLSEDSEGWLLEWNQSGSVFESFGAPAELASLLEPLIGDRGFPPILYTVSVDGTVGDVQNVGELRAALVESTEVLAGILGDGDPTVDRLVAVYAELPDSSIAQIVTEPLQVFHLFGGVAIDVENGTAFDGELTNTFGGAPFAATTTLSVEELVGADGCVHVVSHTSPQPELFAESLAESLQTTFGASEQNAAELEALFAGFEIESHVTATIDAATGRVLRTTATKRVSDGTTEAADTTIIRDVTDD